LSFLIVITVGVIVIVMVKHSFILILVLLLYIIIRYQHIFLSRFAKFRLVFCSFSQSLPIGESKTLLKLLFFEVVEAALL
jgi:hypothetical protein